MKRTTGILARVALVVTTAGLLVLGMTVTVVVVLVIDDKEATLQDEVLDAAALRSERLEAQVALAEAQLGALAESLASGRIDGAVDNATTGVADAIVAWEAGAELIEASRDDDALAALRDAGELAEGVREVRGGFVTVAAQTGDVTVGGVVPWGIGQLPEGWSVSLEEGSNTPGLMARRRGDAATAIAPTLGDLALHVEAPLGPARAAVAEMASRVVLFSALTLLPLLVLAWALSRAVTSPVRRLAEAVSLWRDDAPLDPGELPDDEIGDLGRAIAQMSARVHADAKALRAAARFSRHARGDDTPERVLLELEALLAETIGRWRVLRAPEYQDILTVDAPRRPPASSFAGGSEHPEPARKTLPDGTEAVVIDDDENVAGVLLSEGVPPPEEVALLGLFARTAEARLRAARLSRRNLTPGEARHDRRAGGVGGPRDEHAPRLRQSQPPEPAGRWPRRGDRGGRRRRPERRRAPLPDRAGPVGRHRRRGPRALRVHRPRRRGAGDGSRGRGAGPRHPGPGGGGGLDPHRVRPRRIEQVVLNLLNNALDVVSLDGRVEARVGRIGDRVYVEVEDDGPGIPDDVREKLFDAFFTTKGERGTGLGLHISRSFVEAHGGTLDVTRTGPAGTVFRVELPTLAAPEHRATMGPGSDPVPPPKVRARLLVVDDEPAIVRALSRWLKREADVTGVTSPVEALEVLKRERFDLVLCDLHMPELSGDELARQVRGMADAPRVVVVTGSNVEAPEDLTFLRKPIEPKQLRRLLQTVV
jgi:CheY-like chemotaxis protein/HAMP domain-containing protein